jgi:hypothetical protein
MGRWAGPALGCDCQPRRAGCRAWRTGQWYAALRCGVVRSCALRWREGGGERTVLSFVVHQAPRLSAHTAALAVQFTGRGGRAAATGSLVTRVVAHSRTGLCYSAQRCASLTKRTALAGAPGRRARSCGWHPRRAGCSARQGGVWYSTRRCSYTVARLRAARGAMGWASAWLRLAASSRRVSRAAGRGYATLCCATLLCAALRNSMGHAGRHEYGTGDRARTADRTLDIQRS